jgi:lysophospholipase L1-like esterase
MRLRKILPAVAFCLLLVLLSAVPDKTTTIFVIGDSTAANKDISGGKQERGWGMALQCYFDDNIRIDNHAVNGRSSLSFINEGRWQKVLELMKHDLEGYGITVSSISIENIDFTDAFENAVEAKQVATQDAQKAKTLQDQQTMETQKAAERKKIEADAEAYETKVKAEAEAEANKKIGESITKDLIDYIQAGRWDGKLPGTFVGSDDAMPIINTNEDFSSIEQEID